MGIVAQRLGEPTGTRAQRVLDWAAAWTLDALGERTVWCAAASTAAAPAASALRDRLGRAAGPGLAARLLDLARADAARALEGVAPDAYVLSWHGVDARGGVVECVAAVLPCTATVAERDVPLGQGGREGRRDLAWAAVLGEAAQDDRHETVGGAYRARPLVAAR
jgi:hypothetical protein